MSENQFIYLPGWLNSAENFRPVATLVGGDFKLLDLPVDMMRTVPEMADWVAEQITNPVWLVGHSFGGKIAMAVAARHPDKICGIFVVAGSNRGKFIWRLLRPAIWMAKRIGVSGRRFRTADYENSSPVMRKIMTDTLRFNIMSLAKQVKCAATFIYGQTDTVTQSALGRKLARASGGKFYELAGFNHNTIISDGAYQVSAIIKSIAKDGANV